MIVDDERLRASRRCGTSRTSSRTLNLRTVFHVTRPPRVCCNAYPMTSSISKTTDPTTIFSNYGTRIILELIAQKNLNSSAPPFRTHISTAPRDRSTLK